MAIQDLLRTLGQRASTGLEKMGATTDPRLSPAAQRLAGIQNLSQALRRTGATLSGDPQRMALQAQEDERLRQRRLDEERKRKLMAFAQQDPSLAKMYEVFGEQGLREGYVRKEQIEQQEQINTRLNEAIDKSDFSETQKEMLKSLNIKDKSQFLQENIIPKEEDKKTAAQINLETFNEIAQTGTPEEIEIAERVLVGATKGKSIQQLRNETVANLSKSTNPITGESLTIEEIRERLKIFDDLIDLSTETPSVNNASDMSFDGYNVVEVKR